MAIPHIQVLTDDNKVASSVQDAMDRIHATRDLQRLGDFNSVIEVRRSDARIVLIDDVDGLTDGRRDALHRWVQHDPCPTVICFSSSLAPVSSELVAGVSVTCLCNPSCDVLVGHLSAMCNLGSTMNAMRREVDALRSREETLREKMRQIGHDLRRAGDLQRDLLPHDLPECQGLDIHTLYRPAEVVSGDSYDVVRISPTRIAFTLADATGHGMAAGLLCASFVRSLCRSAKAYCADRDVDPACVLSYLNRELCAADLSECLFVTAVHAVFDESTGVMRMARAGAPYPIHLRRGEKPKVIECEGPAAGMLENARFETVEITLEPGDTLVLHTDGVEDLVIGSQRDSDCARFDETEWFRTLGEKSIRRNLVNLDGLVASRSGTGTSGDDVTVLALERRAETMGEPEALQIFASQQHELAVAG